MGRSKKKRRGAKGPTLAEKADPHELYELSVQDVEQEAEFLEETFLELRGRRPRALREDFCGTANAACRWVAVNRRHKAMAVDIDPAVLASGRKRHVEALTPGARRRLQLIEGDVRTVRTPPADIVCAFNFSYWYFRDRAVMLRYFRAVRRALVSDGLFFLDVFGGADAFRECKEKTKHAGFSYVWEQKSYDPVTGEYICHIHFRFPDGSRLRRAFTYHWRLWTLPELQDLLAEAGFSRSHVYWQGTDEDGEANGEFESVQSAENDPAWIAYIVAER